MKTIYLVFGITIFVCYQANSAPLNVLCGDESCSTKECTHYMSSNKYKHFIDLFTLKDVQPQDYIVRIPFYVLGSRDASIVLSLKKNPDWLEDNLYEILIGGSFNRISIRRRRDGDVLNELQMPKAISAEEITHFLLEITVGGDIVLYSSQFKDKPLIVAHDPNPLPVRYVSFGAYVDYFYNCQKDLPFSAVPKHPLLNTDLLAKIDADSSLALEKYCNRYDSWDYKYEQFHQLSEINSQLQPESYLVRLPFYIIGKKNAHILLSPVMHPDEVNADVYEIVIGATGLFHVQIRRRIGTDVIAKIGKPNLLNGKTPVKFLLEITKSGYIALYSSHDPFTPLLTAHDPTPLPIKYLSFASKDQSLVQYYFICTDDLKDISSGQPILPKVLPSRFGDNVVAATNVNAVGIVTPEYDLNSCKRVQVKENEYKTFIPLKEFVGEHYDEKQIIHLPLLIQGGKNAHIALTSTDTPNWEIDNIYEFVIGAWDNSHVVVRRKKNGEMLESEEIISPINKLMPSKFMLSITPSGQLFIFSDLSAYKPLIWTTDSDPLSIKFISFASNQSEVIDFYYGCPQFTQQLPMVDASSVAKKPLSMDMHPMLENTALYNDIDLKALAYYSKNTESWNDAYESFIVVKDAWRPNGFMLQFVVYIQGIEDAHILLSTEPKVGIDDPNVYEIRLGSQGNTFSQIVRKSDGDMLANIHEQNVLSEVEPLRVIVEISNLGLFKVYTAHNPFVPLLQTMIPPLTQINYIGLASSSRTQFYYDLNESNLLNKPIETDTVLENVQKMKHPLLALNDYPIGYSELYFNKYLKMLHTTPEPNGKYLQWIKLSEIDGVKPIGYLLRFPFYIQGPANAHVLLASRENPTLEDNAYEFLIGGLNNTRVEIRKRINGISMMDVRVPNVLSEEGQKKFVIEITTQGEIKLYSEDNPYRPLAVAFDPNPIDINYISFKNHNSEKLQFYYGNPPHMNHADIVTDLLVADKKQLSVHPLLRHWNNKDLKVDLKTLIQHSDYQQVQKLGDTFSPIDSQFLQKGYALRMEVYLLASSHAVISLANVAQPTRADKIYQIVIGEKGNTVSSINIGGEPKVVVHEQKLLSNLEAIKVVVEITHDGWINVFTSHNPYTPLMSYLDTNVIDVKYVGYWSPQYLQVFVLKKDFQFEPTKQLDTLPMAIDVVKQPFLTVQDYPIGFAAPFFAKYFKHMQTTPKVNNKYVQFEDLSAIENVSTDEYRLRLPFYLRAKANVHIVLSKEEHPTAADDAYEIVIGGWGNTRTVIRKGINGPVLADVFWPNLLSEHRFKKFFIELSAMEIKLYAEDDLYHPIVQSFDAVGFKVHYMSLKNYNNEYIDLFYGNNLKVINDNVLFDLVKEKYGAVQMQPLLKTYKHLLEKLTMPTLSKYSKYFESWSTAYSHFVKIDRSVQPKGLRLQFPVFVQGTKDARILLSSTQTPDALDENVYEIRVGAEDNSLITIGRKIDGVIMGQVYEQNILSPSKLTMLLIEVTDAGQISVWSSHNLWMPLLTVVDPNPLDVKYVSFASSNRLQCFYNVDFTALVNLPLNDAVEQHFKHPLFATSDSPIGVSSLYFKKYTKEFLTVPEQPDQYVQFVALNDIQGAHRAGYLIQLPFYVQGAKMAHLLFSSIAHPTEHDDAYEVVIGDKENSRVILRKRMNGAVLADIYWPNTLSEYKRTKFVFEVSDSGLVQLFSEFDPYNPMLTAFDPVPVPINYLSFKNWLPMKMIFNLAPKELTEIDTKKKLLLDEYKTLALNPLWSHWSQIASKVDAQHLMLNGKYYESVQDVYTKVLPIGGLYKPIGYAMRFPVYTQGVGVVKFMLTSVENVKFDTDIYYEIELGLGGNSWSRILKNGIELTRVYEPNLLQLWKPTKWFIEMTTDGLIKVFSSHNLWMPLMTAVTTPIDVKYIAFASQSRIQFFYDVNEEHWRTVSNVQDIPSGVDVNVKHPLFNAIDYPIGLTDLFFEKYYKTIVTKPTIRSTYTEWINLDEIEDIRPNGYLLRMPFYLHGANDAQIIISSSDKPTETDVAYEFVIGGLNNGHVSMRKRINGPVLADIYWPNALSVWRKKKFVLEITTDGYIRLYNEDFPYWPMSFAFDSIPANVKLHYLSVKNMFGKPLYLSYGKPAAVKPDNVFMDLLTEKYGIVQIHPLFENWKKLQHSVDLRLLSQHGKYLESWQPKYTFIAADDKYKPSGYVLQFALWVQSAQDLRILLAPHVDARDEAFEIHFGTNDNTLITLVRSVKGVDSIWSASEQNILSDLKPVKLVIQLTVDGEFSVFTSHNPFVPVLTVSGLHDLLPIKHIGFASASHSNIVYDVDEALIRPFPAKQLMPATAKHPLLATDDYPLGFSRLFFQDYLHHIETTPDGNQTAWLKLSDLNGLRPKGYLVRMPFYIKSFGDSIVLLAENENPTEFDNVYEILIGGYKRSRVILRKRLNGAILANVYWPNVVSSAYPKKFVLEVTLGGDISLFSQDNPFVALLNAFDPQPFTVNYLAYRNLFKQYSTFYIRKSPLENQQQIFDQLLKKYYGAAMSNPLLLNWQSLAPKMTLKNLVKYGKYYESLTPSFSHVIPITDQYRPFGYKLRYPLYIAGESDANILLSSVPSPGLDDDAYEITIGWRGNSFAKIVNRRNGDVHVIAEYGILSPLTPVKVIIDISNEGVVSIFTSHNPFVPLLSVPFANQFDLKYISFGSVGRAQFFHDVDEQTIEQLPVVIDAEAIDYVEHSLLPKSDYPIGMAELFFKKFYNIFVSTPAIANSYTKFIKLGNALDASDIEVPFYVRGNGDAYVLFSSVVNPTAIDEAYELLIGGWDNKYVILRKRINGPILAKVYLPNIISDVRRKKFVFDVSVDGHIKLHAEDSPSEPIFSVFDPTPVRVHAMSFKSNSIENVEFISGAKPSMPMENVVSDLISSSYGPMSTHPAFINWNKIMKTLNLNDLFLNSRYYESWNDVYTHVMPIDAKWKPNGFPLRFPIFAHGAGEVRILLSSVEKPNVGDLVYEIRIDAVGNALTSISKQIDGEPIVRVYEQNLLSAVKPVKFVVEMTADGIIQVFSSFNPYVPLISWKDPNPLPIKFISLASGEHMQYFYDVNESRLLSGAAKPVVEANVKHPLLSILDFTYGLKDMLLKKLIYVYETMSSSPNKYTQFVKLADFKDSRPSGYLLRWPFLVQGSVNVHILASSKMNPTEMDDAYEIIIGAVQNDYIVIKKRINGVVLADGYVSDVLSDTELKKFVLDITEDGFIKLYSEMDLFNPIITAYDPIPLKIKYVSYRNLFSEKLSFYYGFYPSDQIEKRVLDKNTLFVDPLMLDRKNPLISPVDGKLSQWSNQNALQIFASKLLVQNSKYYESWDKVFGNSIALSKQYQPLGYLVRFPVYLQGSHDAYILLTTNSEPSVSADVYEIQIGAAGNTIHQIKKNGKVMVKVNEPKMLSPQNPTKFLIEITTDGIFKVFTANNPLAPLLYFVDSNPINVKYIHFASLSRMQFFYDIDEETINLYRNKLQRNRNDLKPAAHPLIVSLNVPVDMEDIYFKNHFKVYEPVVSNKYEKWLKLSDIEHIQPAGFIVRLPFFVQGSSNAHMIFSPVQYPSLNENVYEILIGGFGNTRIVIRKRIDGVLLADSIVPNILNVLKKKQFVFEVSIDGEIKLYGEDLMEPLLVAYDPKPIAVVYLSFKNLNDEKLSFFYGYNPEQLPNVIVPVAESMTKRPLTTGLGFRPTFPQLNIRDNILGNVFDIRETKDVIAEAIEPIQITNAVGIKYPKVVKYEPVVRHTLFEEILPHNVDMHALVKSSQYVESWSNDEPAELVKVTGNMQSAGYPLQFPFYVQGAQNVYVQLWSADTEHYEIQYGVVDNSVARIVRQPSGKVLAEIVQENLLDEWQLIKMIVEVSRGGVINLYTAHNVYAPLLTVVDPNPIAIKYITFGADTRAQFVYDVNEKTYLAAVAVPTVHIEEKEHPLLSAVNAPIFQTNEWLNKTTKVSDTSKLTDYKQLIKLNDLKMVVPVGYKVQLPLFIDGTQNARILLAANNPIDIDDAAYEIIIGSWMNSRIEIRKRINGPIIAKAVVPNVLSSTKLNYFVIEVTADGYIRVFSKDDRVKPLISTFDPNPVDINYLGFSSYMNEPVKFFYDYYYDHSGAEQLLNKRIPFKYSLADLDCEVYISELTSFESFIKISELASTQISQFSKTFTLYVYGSKDTSIVLANSLAPNREVDIVYEILIGSIYDRKPLIIPHKLAAKLEYDVLFKPELVKIDIEIGNGKIRIFKDYETDPWFEQNYVGNDLNYVSLGAPSGSSIIHYNCSA